MLLTTRLQHSPSLVATRLGLCSSLAVMRHPSPMEYGWIHKAQAEEPGNIPMCTWVNSLCNTFFHLPNFFGYLGVGIATTASVCQGKNRILTPWSLAKWLPFVEFNTYTFSCKNEFWVKFWLGVYSQGSNWQYIDICSGPGLVQKKQ